MMRNTPLGIALIVSFAWGWAAADTLHMKNGTRVDGQVAKQDAATVTLRIGNREVVFRAAEIARVEKNAKTGGFDLDKAKADAANRQRALFQQTGLTTAQRSKVKELMWHLQSSDPSVSADARRELVAMGGEIDLVKYFQWHLPALSHRLVPGVLEVLCELDKAKAKTLLRRHSTDLHAPTRAKVLALMGRVGDTGSIDILARGLVDPEPEVQAAAAEALGRLKVKQATPALIATLRVPDIKVQNACRLALRTLWSTGEDVVDFESVKAWEAFWQTHYSEVAFPLTVASLAPLVDENAKFEDE